ncbi:MAG: MFS transporter [Pararhodobacter sp.]|nr:MFS transporter [Pararhodobacter sp.]
MTVSGERRVTAWGAVTLAVLGGVMAAVHVGKLPPALPVMRDELGFGLVAGGFVISLFNLLGMFLALIVGALAGGLGRERLVLAGFVCLVAGGVTGALAQDLPVLMLSRLLEGVGFVAIGVSLPAVVLAASARRDQDFALGMWSVYTPLGMALAMLAAPLALSGLGWRGLWLAVALLCLPVALAIWWQMRAVAMPSPPRRAALGLVREAASTAGLQHVALVFALYAFQWVTLMVWLPTFQTESLGASLERAALVTAIVVLVNVPGCLLGGWLMRRGASARALVLTGSTAMGVTAIAIFLPILPDAARLAACLVFSFLGGLVPPSLFNCVPRVVSGPQLVGAGNGMLMQGSAMGQFAGAPLVAWAVSLAGGDWRFALVPMLAAALAASVVALALPRRHIG